MRVTDTAIAFLAALSLCEAQGVNFSQVYKVKPAMKTLSAKPQSTTSKINTSATASSIVSSFSSGHAATMTTSKKPTTTTSKKSTTSSKKTTAKTTSKKPATTTKHTTAKTTPKTTTKHTTTKKTTTKHTTAKTTPKTTAKHTTTKKTTTKHTTTKKTTTKHTTAKATTKAKRAELVDRAASSSTTSSILPCTSQEILYGYVPSPNTPVGFMTDNSLGSLSNGAYLPPAGYSTNFTGLFGSLSANNYMGYYQLPSYDPAACAAHCDNQPGCQAVNLYFERDPTLNPQSNCPNPDAAVQVSCALWGAPVNAAQSNNFGGYRADFMVVITGSNGYNLNPSPASFNNFTGPQALAAAVNVNTIGGKTVYIGSQFFNTYDPAQCGNLCTSTTASNRAAAIKNNVASYTACNYFNTFYIDYANTHYGMYCQLYTTSDVADYANTTYTAQSGSVTYNLTYSYGYTANYTDVGLVNPPIITPTAGACTALQTGATTTNKTLFRDSSAVNYTLGCGLDLTYLGDIGNQSAASYGNCFSLCDNFTDCNAFSFLSYVCYFKNLANVYASPSSVSNVDLAWIPASFTPAPSALTVSFKTVTTAWTGAATTTTTAINGLSGTVYIETPGKVSTTAAPTGTVYVTTSINSGTVTTVSTTTVAPTKGGKTGTVTIAYPTPATTCGNVGVSWAGYNNMWVGGQNTASYPAYTPEYYKNVKPTATGQASYLGESNDSGQRVNVYGSTYYPSTTVLDHVFYVMAHMSGYWTFTIPYVDDVTFVWVGGKALQGWNRGNADIMQTWPNTNAVSISYYFTIGQYVPVRVQWANGGNAGDLQFAIYSPDGKTVMQTTPNANAGTMGPQIITNPCNAAYGADFLPWGSEL